MKENEKNSTADALTKRNLCAVILAAGEGKRMRSSKPKVLLEVLLKPMLGWVLDAARASGVGDICVVTGHLEEQVKAYLGDSAVTVTQAERKGTGHAVMMTREFLEGHRGGQVLIACGDAPFLGQETITRALEQHYARGDALTVISATLDDPTGYGRIIRNPSGAVKAIIEQKEATPEELDVNEVNSGAYWFDVDVLLDILDTEHLPASEITGEHYLTDAVAAIINEGCGVGAFAAPRKDIVEGANTPVQLHRLSETARTFVIDELIADGVNIPCTDGVIIGPDVVIGADAVILPGTVLTGKTVIGDGCRIGPTSVIENSIIGKNVIINASQVYESVVKDGTVVGPYSHIRPGCEIGENILLGNFVEMKNATMGADSYVSHMAYIGDCDVGADVNLGFGSVTVNFDGRAKYRSSIGDGAMIGCNTNLIAPVSIGKGAFTAAGTTVTEDIPDNAMAIGRTRQEIKTGWVQKRDKKDDN